MKYFKPEEFHGWHEFVSLDLLQMLDDFRHAWGMPVMVSPASGAVGRHLGPAESYHNFDRWGQVRAVDVMPLGMASPEQALEAERLAQHVGINGIGIYPHWRPRPGLHLDNRDKKARWGGILVDGVQKIVSLDEAIAKYYER